MGDPTTRPNNLDAAGSAAEGAPTPSETSEETPRGGRCAILGRPNVGKSTLLNALLGQKLVIATPRPGTTRSAVLGVYVAKEPPTQIAFVDTPGLGRAKTALHHVLHEQAQQGMSDTEVVLLVTEAHRREGVHPADRTALAMLQNVHVPVLLAVNKVDTMKDKRWLLPFIEAYREAHPFGAVIPISATRRINLAPLVEEVRSRLPEGVLYEEDVLTDRPERFFAAELIREAVIRHTRQEVPYGAAVLLDSYTEEGRLTRILATIIVEKPSHKGIVIGKGGSLIKTIGIEAREAIERFLERKVHLELHVKVAPGWTADPLRARSLATEVER